MSYPIFVIFIVFVLSEVSWTHDVAPVMLDRVQGESFLNPMDISKLRDFNMFMLIVYFIGTILNRAAWIGNDTSGAGRNAHEQKMAGVLGAWRNGFSMLMLSLLALFILTTMLGSRFADDAKEIRVDLVSKVSEETVADKKIRQQIINDIAARPPVEHVIGKDKPYSRKSNPDVDCLNVVKRHLDGSPDKNVTFQKFRTLYYQMMAPTVLRKKLPPGVIGTFVLLMVMLMLSTDDSRIFNASSTIIQDVIMPFRKKPFKPEQHLLWLRMMSLGVCGFFLYISLFMAQIDYIAMFISIMCALWLGAAGPIMIGGLYTRFGTTAGAFCALIFGSGTSLFGMIMQRTWAGHVYPWLYANGYEKYVNSIFEAVTSVCAPLIVWEMNPAKFPINSYEIYFCAMMFGCAAYLIGSLLTYRKPYNLDRLLHRGKYSEEDNVEQKKPWSWSNVYSKMIGITDEYTCFDRIIAWGVFFYSFVLQFLILFVFVAVWNLISPWPAEWWTTYFFITIIVIGLIVGSISTVWFMTGGIIDLRRLFKDLAARVDNPLDDGWVVGHVALADADKIGTEEEKKEAVEEEDGVFDEDTA